MSSSLIAPDFRRYLPFVLVGAVIAGLFVWSTSETESPGTFRMPLNEVRDNGIVYVEEQKMFLVARGESALALSDHSQHVGDTVAFCRSSGLFESAAHGEKFDRDGRYFAGPADSDMDRYRSWIKDGFVYVDTDQLIETQSRSQRPAEPRGPFCVGDLAAIEENGFFTSP